MDGSVVDADEAFLDRRNLAPPKGEVESFLILTDGTRVTLPFCCIAYRIPDKTGVVAIFEPGQCLNAQGEDMFPRPHNAAIFNADGSLRFQLKANGLVHRIAAFHGGAMPDRYANHMGVLIAAHDEAQPEWVYAVDLTQPELIPTGQWVRY